MTLHDYAKFATLLNLLSNIATIVLFVVCGAMIHTYWVKDRPSPDQTRHDQE